jgi:hypothetical protein
MSAAGTFWSAFVDGLSFGGNGELPGVPKRLFRRESAVVMAAPGEIVSVRKISKDEIAQLALQLWQDRVRSQVDEYIERRQAG